MSFTGQTYAIEGDLNSALHTWNQGIEYAQKSAVMPIIENVASGYMAEIEYERDKIDQATASVDRYFNNSTEIIFPDMVRSQYLTRSRLFYLQGKLHEANAVLDEAEAISLQRGWERIVNAIKWERVHLALRANDEAKAQHLQSTINYTPQCNNWESHVLGNFRYQAQFNPCREVIAGIHKSALNAMQNNCLLFMVRLLIIESIARHHSGNRNGALRVLNRELRINRKGLRIIINPLRCSGQRIEPLDLLRPTARVDGFQHQGDIIETRVAHDMDKHALSQFPHIEAMVTVDMAAELGFTAVEMHPLEVLKPDHLIEFGKRGAAALFAAQVVTGGKGMAGIEADTDPAFILHLLDNRRQVFEAMSQVGTLPCRVLDHRGNAVGLLQRNIDRFGNA